MNAYSVFVTGVDLSGLLVCTSVTLELKKTRQYTDLRQAYGALSPTAAHWFSATTTCRLRLPLLRERTQEDTRRKH